MVGDYFLTAKDMASDDPFPDTIAIFPNVDRNETSDKHPLMYIPYRALIPANVDSMLIACRAFSSDGLSDRECQIVHEVFPGF